MFYIAPCPEHTYELPRPLAAPFQAAAAMILPGEVTATALLAAYLWHHLRQTVLLSGKSTVWRALTA